ncbi:MAG: ParB/RepB/Spo0J family partition protein [Acidobacteriota bacterium]
MPRKITTPSLPGVGQIGPIPIERIRPFKGQPRTHFDEAALRELADSIAANGQKTPAWVIPPDEHGIFELTAGERRWRACLMAGIPTLLCEVRRPESAADRYIDSVMENFGRKDCTVLEAARAVREVARLKFGDKIERGMGAEADAAVAKVFARSAAWVQQMKALLRLHPHVLQYLEPPQKLTTQVALTLANLQPEMQISLADDIVKNGMRVRTALAHVRNNVTEDARVRRIGRRRRRPSEDFEILSRFLANLGESAQVLIEMGDERIEAMFRNRQPKDRQIVAGVLQKRIGQLQRLERIIQ